MNQRLAFMFGWCPDRGSQLGLAFRLVILGVLFAGLAGCVTDSSSHPTLRAGMSREDLRACFGPPLRVEAAPDGGENWFYLFSAWSPPQLGGAAERDPFDPNVSTVSVTMSSSHGTKECAVHLSAEGYVLDPIPAGKIVAP